MRKDVHRSLVTRQIAGNTYRWLVTAVAVLAGVLLTAFASVRPVQAADIISPSQTGKITVTVNQDEFNIEGAKFHIYKVADLTEDAEYNLTFKPLVAGIDQKDVQPANPTEAVDENGRNSTSSQWEDMTDKIQKAVQDTKAPEVKSAVMQGRRVEFDGLTAGLYLVVGDQATEGNKTVTYQPVVVCLPQGGTAQNSQWSFDVTSHVKTAQASYTQEPPKPSEPAKPSTPLKTVKTGDTGRIEIWMGVICGAAAAIIALSVAKRKSKQSK